MDPLLAVFIMVVALGFGGLIGMAVIEHKINEIIKLLEKDVSTSKWLAGLPDVELDIIGPVKESDFDETD